MLSYSSLNGSKMKSCRIFLALACKSSSAGGSHCSSRGSLSTRYYIFTGSVTELRGGKPFKMKNKKKKKTTQPALSDFFGNGWMEEFEYLSSKDERQDSWIFSHLVSVSKAAGGGARGGECRSDESDRSAAKYFVKTSSQKPWKWSPSRHRRHTCADTRKDVCVSQPVDKCALHAVGGKWAALHFYDLSASERCIQTHFVEVSS